MGGILLREQTENAFPTHQQSIHFLKCGSVNKSNLVKLPLKSSVYLFVVQCVVISIATMPRRLGGEPEFLMPVVQHLLQQAVLLQRLQPPASVC